MDAVIYIAHGSRRDLANQKFIAFVSEINKQQPLKLHAHAFLEHAGPTIQEAVDDCVQKGAKEITIVPVFLSQGVHVNEDIPTEVEEAKERYPSLLLRSSPPLGVDESMVKILLERLDSSGFRKSKNEAVLLIGHGSRIKEAGVELEQLAGYLGKEIGWEVHTAFLTTSNYYDEKVKELQSYQKIYLLPYFLFTGGFTVKMEKALAAFKEKIIFCDPIGFDSQLIPLIQKRSEGDGLVSY